MKCPVCCEDGLDAAEAKFASANAPATCKHCARTFARSSYGVALGSIIGLVVIYLLSLAERFVSWLAFVHVILSALGLLTVGVWAFGRFSTLVEVGRIEAATFDETQSAHGGTKLASMSQRRSRDSR